MSREGGEAMAAPVSREQLLEVYSHGMHTAALLPRCFSYSTSLAYLYTWYLTTAGAAVGHGRGGGGRGHQAAAAAEQRGCAWRRREAARRVIPQP